MRVLVSLVAVILTSSALVLPAALAETEQGTITPDDVVRMVAGGLGEDVIIAKIRESGESFSLSVDDLLELRDAGVPDAVLATMVRTNVEAKREAVASDLEARAVPRIEADVAWRWYSRPWRPRYVYPRARFGYCYDSYGAWGYGTGYPHSYGGVYIGYGHSGGHGHWPYKSASVHPKKTGGGRGGRH